MYTLPQAYELIEAVWHYDRLDPLRLEVTAFLVHLIYLGLELPLTWHYVPDLEPVYDTFTFDTPNARLSIDALLLQPETISDLMKYAVLKGRVEKIETSLSNWGPGWVRDQLLPAPQVLKNCLRLYMDTRFIEYRRVQEITDPLEIMEAHDAEFATTT